MADVLFIYILKYNITKSNSTSKRDIIKRIFHNLKMKQIIFKTKRSNKLHQSCVGHLARIGGPLATLSGRPLLVHRRSLIGLGPGFF